MKSNSYLILLRSKKTWFAAFLLLVVAGGLSWKRIMLEYMSNETAKYFAEDYSVPPTIKRMPYDYSIRDWAFLFGGTFSLNRLVDFSESSQLTPEGRKKAKEIHRFISGGGLVHYFDPEEYRNSMTWTSYQMRLYVFDRDRKALNILHPESDK